MAATRCDFKNMMGSMKCAVSPPRIVSLEIRDESPDGSSKCDFDGFFRNALVSSDINSVDNVICGNDNNPLNRSGSASTTDKRHLDQVSSVNLLQLLNSPESEESGVENFPRKKNATNDKMKIISDFEVSDGLSELLASVPCDTSLESEGKASVKSCLQKNNQNCDIRYPDFDFVKNKCRGPFLEKLSKSSVTVEGNLSDLLSSINIEDCNIKKFGNSNSSCISNSKEEPCLSDLLSSICHEASSFNKNSNSKPSVCYTKIVEADKESSLADLLSSINVHKPASNSLPLKSGSSKSSFKNGDDTTDLLKDLTFNSESCSSSNSCASSFSDTDNSSSNNLFTDDSDSGFDSEQKEFSFFDYSSGAQVSFDKLLSNKSDVSIISKHSDDENGKCTVKEMSMSDLMTIVSPEFKIPVLSTLNKSDNKDTSGVPDLFGSLNSESKNFNTHNVNGDSEKLLNSVCADSEISSNIQSAKDDNALDSGSVGKGGVYAERSNITVDEDSVTSDDEQNTDIDLRACIKSPTRQFTPIKKPECSDDQLPGRYSPCKIPLYCEDKLPLDLSQNRPSLFEFNETVPEKKAKINCKQTLFSKALSCKPKKDPFLLQKVASIKNELLHNIMFRPVHIGCDVPQPITEPVQQSYGCIWQSVGRRTFGLDVSCELL